MATYTAYEDLLPELIAMTPGCSDTMIRNAIRSAAIEFCEGAGVYQSQLDPISTVKGEYEYEFEAPANTRVHKILWVNYQGTNLEPISTSLLEERLPSWRTTIGSTPEYYVKNTSTTLSLVPVPANTVANSTTIRVQLKPTHDSTQCDADVMSDYRDAIVHGALFRLLRMPSKDWTDYTAAGVYGNLFTQGVEAAKLRARHQDEGVARSVKYGGFAPRRTSYRNKYGSQK